MDAKRLNPFQPSTSPWDDSFTAGGSRGRIVFPSAVPPYADPMVPIIRQSEDNVSGLSLLPSFPTYWDATAIQLTMAGAAGGTTWVDQKFGLTPFSSAACTTSITEPYFWGSATFVDGDTGSYRGLQFADTTAFTFGANDLTIEGWFWADGADVLLRQYACLASRGNNVLTTGGWGLYINTANATDGIVRFVAYPGVQLIGTKKHNNAAWHHVAVTRLGAFWSLYIDGVQEATQNINVTLGTTSDRTCFGGGYGFTPSLRGYLSEWRIINGISAYSGSSFAVPTAPFPTS